ncbi:hypothetical protein AAF712_013987 [Marasmius tenuissimus]|uniref:Uncharacterized protein n=1 Tax=Marasmius tenuissimus TaxID=585030 RepID=A0ABR2ZDL2_9AGAR
MSACKWGSHLQLRRTLNGLPRWANATLNEDCAVENTAYIAYTASGAEFINIVSRGNCRVGLYCDAQARKCLQSKKDGEECTSDKECESWNCQIDGICGLDSAASFHIGAWVYVLVGLGICGGMVVTLLGLFVLHRRQRDVDREKRMQYWREQSALHQNLNQMRETARASIQSLSGLMGTTNGTRVDGAYSPVPPQGSGKGSRSGLRNKFAGDDGNSVYDDSPVQTPRVSTSGR